MQTGSLRCQADMGSFYMGRLQMLHLEVSSVHLLLIITQLPPFSHSSSEDTCRQRAPVISEHTRNTCSHA